MLPLQPAARLPSANGRIVVSCSEPNPNIAVFQVFFWLATLWTGAPLSQPCNNHARPARKILLNCLGLESGCAQDIGNRVGLRCADFEEEPPLLGQHLARSGGDQPVGVEPVRAAIEREMRVVSRHVGGEPGNLAGGNVRRVGENQVEFGRRRRRANWRR